MRRLFGLCLLLIATVLPWSEVDAAGVTLSFSPNQGQYLTDSTFDVSLVLNTNGQAINALEVYMSYPADKLQIVSPTTGNSFISIWIAGPSYSNTDGTATFSGGLPTPGITTSAGIISTVKFRAKASGKAIITYQTKSKILANDISGTSLPITSGQAVINISNAPPAGPVVSSTSHEDPGKWYADRTFLASWEAVGSEYSYIFDQSPTTAPDETAETTTTTVAKTVEEDGQWYFHIRAKRNGVWGATTHFVFRVDTTPPAKFTIQADTLAIRSGERGIFSFVTTDSGSGVDYYEVRVMNQSGDSNEATTFIEATSPYQLPQLSDGRYRLIVRATDFAGNSVEQSVDFTVGIAAAGAGNYRSLISNPALINIAVISSIFLLLLLLLILIRNYREKNRLNRVINEVRHLQEEIKVRRQELEKLENAYGQTSSNLNSLVQGDQPRQTLPTQQL